MAIQRTMPASVFAGLIAGITATTVYYEAATDTETTVTPSVAKAATEIKTADKDVLLAEAANAGAKSEITCKVGGASNYPERCYCSDGATAGWLSDAAACEEKIEIVGGKVYAGSAAAAEAVK